MRRNLPRGGIPFRAARGDGDRDRVRIAQHSPCSEHQDTSERKYVMRLHLEFCYDHGGWMLRGLPCDAARRLDDLADAMDYAKDECAGAPAIIELLVGDFHAIAFQDLGWSRPLCSPNPRRVGASAIADLERTTDVMEMHS